MERELYDIEPLKVAIVSSVVSDLCKAIKKNDKTEIAELEDWMQSEWGALLCEYKGEYIADRCRDLVKTKKQYSYIKRSVEDPGKRRRCER